MAAQTLYAALIGINAYPQNQLSGCIKDVLDIDLLLRELCGQQEQTLAYEPVYLLAPNATDKFRIEDYNTIIKNKVEFSSPSFKNISGLAFEHLKKAKDGDTCLFFYSGHGSQTDAPEVFWHTKPDRQNETIVCVDSRDNENPGSRDLVDKELGFLIWDAIQGKNVHCLVIMDCCHSGNNMRGMEDHDIGYRFVASSRNNISIEQYLGYDKGNFYEIKDGKASIKIGRYVHLAAARDSEKAQETKNGGLFTNKLIELLRSGGTVKSYRDLVQNLSVTIRNRAEQQNPVAFARMEEDLDLQFLGKKLVPYQPTFEIRFDFGRKQWLLYGGAMHGLFATARHARTIIEIPGYENDIDILEVFATISIPDQEATAGLDKNRNDYKAILKQLANPVIKISLSGSLMADAELADQLQEAYEKEPHLYFEIDFDIGLKAPDYLVRITTGNEFVLTKNNSEVPLFKREQDPTSFLRNVDAVGKWLCTSELKNNNANFSKEDFLFTLEKIEGQGLTPENLDQLTGEQSIIQPGEDIVLSYKNGEQPAFRLSISIAPSSSLQSCFTGALYLESKFAIKNEFIRDDNNRLVKGGTPVNLSVGIKNRIYKTLPVQLDPKYSLYHINEITAILKIFVAEQPPDLQRFKQPNLELDDKPNLKFRGDDIGFARDQDNLGDQTDWTVFTFKIRLIGPNKFKILEPGNHADFPGFSVDVPPGFTANAIAATGDDLQRKLSHASRESDQEIDQNNPAGMPPAGIWGDIITEVAPFAGGLNAVSDNSIQALELFPFSNNPPLELGPGEEIIIKPFEPTITTRSEDEFEETIIPFGFDEIFRLYFPIGYSDEDGNIHIIQLPPKTTGTLQTSEQPSPGFDGSIKLFFKKIFRKKRLNSLVLYACGATGNWEPVNDKPAGMKALLAKNPGAKIWLLTHGLTGDTRHMMECIKKLPELSEKPGYILTYDYENLVTPIAKTAVSLDEDLRDAGFGEANMPGIIFIAHSQGGLVARWVVEKLGGSDYIKQLILVGVPSGGTELETLGTPVLGLLTHALNVPGSIKYDITGLSFLLKKLAPTPGRTLKETNQGSELLLKLANSDLPAGVVYQVIGGDINLLKDGYNGDDYFLKKLAMALQNNQLYPGFSSKLYKDEPNDMAVTLESIKSIPGFTSGRQMKIVPGNHLAYFRETSCTRALIDFLNSSG